MENVLILFVWIIIFIIGYIIIYFSADYLIDNLKNLSYILKASPFIIGILILGLDPEETIASLMASINNLPLIAVGNVIGNSIISISICFSIPALFFKIKFEKVPEFFGWIILIGSIFILSAFLFNYGLIITGIINLIIFILYILKNFKDYKKSKRINLMTQIKLKENNEVQENYDFNSNKIFLKKLKYSLNVIIFLILLLIGGEILIFAAKQLLKITNFTESFFGFIIIAFLTNAEELTLIEKSIKKNQLQIGFGGMIGKLIWNIYFTYSISAIIGFEIGFDILSFYNAFLLMILSLYFFILLLKQEINKFNSILLIILFILFISINFYKIFNINLIINE